MIVMVFGGVDGVGGVGGFVGADDGGGGNM